MNHAGIIAFKYGNSVQAPRESWKGWSETLGSVGQAWGAVIILAPAETHQ